MPLRVVDTNPQGVTMLRNPDFKLKKLAAALTPAALDDPSDDDRTWFAAHPGANYRRRPPFPGEDVLSDPPPGWTVTAVDVWKVGPGIRIRVGVISQCRRPDA